MKKEDIILRDAVLSDFEFLMELYKQLYESEYLNGHNTYANMKTPKEFFECKGFKKAINQTKKMIKDKKIKFIVATHNDKVIGYINGHIKNSAYQISKVLYGDELIVNKEYRGFAVADLLGNELVKWGKKKGAKHIEMEVFSENKPAMSMYLKAGFKERHVCLYKDL